MDKIIYNENITNEELIKNNIVIEKSAVLGKNIKLSHGVCILGDSVVEDNCVIENNSVVNNSKLRKGVKVLSSFIEDSEVGELTIVGPFTNIKKNSKIGSSCRIGNFVEIKNSIVGDESKIAHLTYVGDAEMGKNCNIGCGVVFCNYNGKIKQRSQLGDNVFVGSNVNIVAPVKVESEAYIAAGSTINKDITKGQFSIARKEQINKDNFKNPYIEKLKNK